MLRISFKKNLLLILLHPFLVSSVNAYMQSRHIQMSVAKDMVADGNFIGEEEINFTVGGTLSGAGYFKGVDITLKVGRFAFTGTIECTRTCHIITAEPFDEAMFTREGSGMFVITVDATLAFQDAQAEQFDGETTRNQEHAFSHVEKMFSQDHLAEAAATKKIDIDGLTFTMTGEWNIEMAEAIERNDLQAVRDLVATRPTCLYDQRMLDIYLLLAGLYEHMSLMQEFIAWGANVNGKDNHLITAIAARKAAFVHQLIQADADPNVTKPDRTPALIFAVLQDDIALVSPLLQSPKLRVNARDCDGRTALMYAAYYGLVDVVKLLLQHGATPQLQDWTDHLTALDYAVRSNNIEICELLKPKSSVVRQDSPIKESATKESVAAIKLQEMDNKFFFDDTHLKRHMLYMTGAMLLAMLVARPLVNMLSDML